jgi:hypothetical protein
VAAAVVLAGCGDGDASGEAGATASASSSAAAAAELSGVYDTRVTLTESTCDGIEVADAPTTLEQDGDTLTVSHAALVLTGTVGPDGAFTTALQQVEVGPDTHALSAAGTVADGHLSAEVSAEVSGSRACRYTVSWDGDVK